MGNARTVAGVDFGADVARSRLRLLRTYRLPEVSGIVSF
jgi:hypothetical protein